MEELKDILKDILTEMKEMNNNLGEVKSDISQLKGREYNSIDDVVESLSNIESDMSQLKGNEYNSIDDIIKSIQES